jgi:integrase
VPVLNDDELAALLKACQGKTLVDRRDEAVIRFLIDTGCKLRGVRIRPRGPRPRPRAGDRHRQGPQDPAGVLRSPHHQGPLDHYLRAAITPLHALPGTFLFQRGQLSPDGVRDLLTRRAKLAGLTGLNPIRFRHTFAHDFLLAGGQERDLKRLAGWSSDVMLERCGSSPADVRAREAVKRMRRDRV